jgi:hypothetical protein
VVVIPNDRRQIAKEPPLAGLKGFDPQEYKVPLGPPTKKHPDGKPTVTVQQRGLLMGDVTNLIADMTIRGASSEEKARAVRHSMVVIDSEKHNLDVKASARQNGILDLKRKYQGVHPRTGQPRGASTLITRATAQYHVPRRADAPAGPGLVRVSSGTIDVKTGRKVHVETGEHNVRFKDEHGKLQTKSFRSKALAEQYVREHGIDGKIEVKRFKSKRLAETNDAFELVSEGRGTPIERIYAEHSNRLKALANEARRGVVSTKLIPYSPSANKVYKHEVHSLNAKLDIALKNSPLERQAQVVANRIVAQKKRANPGMEKDEERKLKGQALTEARLRTGAGKQRIKIEPREWEAIQAGAISNHMLEKIINNSDLDTIRERATPRENPVMSSIMTSRARQMLALGVPLVDVADQLGVALSTLQSAVA